MSDEPQMTTAEKITMGQLIGLYRASDNADVVRAAMLLLHGDPAIASFRDPAGFERVKAAELCADAWNKREVARTAPAAKPGRLNQHGAWICGPCSSGNHLGVQHGGTEHALCQCTCDGQHDKYGRQRPASALTSKRRSRR